MKKYFIILFMALLPSLALAQKAGGHVTRPGKAKSKTEKLDTIKKQTGKKQNSVSLQQQSQSVSSYTDSNGNRVFNIGNVQFTMVKVDGGSFMMGATPEQGSDAFDSERPAHSVTLSSYYIGQTEVTQELWQAVMGSNPSHFKGARRPVEMVSWDDCQTFLLKLNSLTGQNFKLPTEAQWEFAARGGNRSHGNKYSGSNDLDSVAWHFSNRSNETHNVATKQANELGIYDMSGNVWEWCSDWKGNYSSGSQTNPTGPDSGYYRVDRGGCWYSSARGCRVSDRGNSKPDDQSIDLGLRLAL